MSRIGKTPIKLNSATIEEIDDFYVVKGPKGEVRVKKQKGISIENKDNEVNVKPSKVATSATWGLVRSLLAGAVSGVEEGFEKRLEMVGVGYRAQAQGKKLVVNAGFSHPIDFEVPEGIEVSVEDNTKIIVKGSDKQLVGQVAANIKKIRKPEPYKGKGIKYENEVIRRKAGKAGKGAE